jgi:hypothetical protein
MNQSSNQHKGTGPNVKHGKVEPLTEHYKLLATQTGKSRNILMPAKSAITSLDNLRRRAERLLKQGEII